VIAGLGPTPATASRSSLAPTRGVRCRAARRANQAIGAKFRLLPKNSPDRNPIEMLFAKLKHWLRDALVRSVETACAASGETLDAVTAPECQNYFAQAD
jgi:transposase